MTEMAIFALGHDSVKEIEMDSFIKYNIQIMKLTPWKGDVWNQLSTRLFMQSFTKASDTPYGFTLS